MDSTLAPDFWEMDWEAETPPARLQLPENHPALDLDNTLDSNVLNLAENGDEENAIFDRSDSLAGMSLHDLIDFPSLVGHENWARAQPLEAEVSAEEQVEDTTVQADNHDAQDVDMPNMQEHDTDRDVESALLEALTATLSVPQPTAPETGVPADFSTLEPAPHETVVQAANNHPAQQPPRAQPQPQTPSTTTTSPRCTSCHTPTPNLYLFRHLRATADPRSMPGPFCLPCSERFAVDRLVRQHPFYQPHEIRAKAISLMINNGQLHERLLVADHFKFCRCCLRATAFVNAAGEACEDCKDLDRCSACGRDVRLTGRDAEGRGICRYCARIYGARVLLEREI